MMGWSGVSTTEYTDDTEGFGVAFAVGSFGVGGGEMNIPETPTTTIYYLRLRRLL